MYQDILSEMKSRIEAKERNYTDLADKRKAELMDMAKEVDLLMDRRRNRKARASG